VLADEEWSKLSSRLIAEMCGVSHTFVDNVRKESTCNGCKLTDEKRVGADGKSRSLPKPKPSTSEALDTTEEATTDDDMEYVDADDEPATKPTGIN
jgi:hypothetical protein